jgi:DNA-binding Xre family transcriptional regulator
MIGKEKHNMPGKISNKFRVLLAEKADREKRNISLAEVQRETKIPWSSLQKWQKNDVERFDSKVIMKLCDYLGCEIKDLLLYIRERQEIE